MSGANCGCGYRCAHNSVIRPTDDQLREAARRMVCTDDHITVEPNGTIWRTPNMAFVTCVVAVPLNESGEVEG